MDTSEKNLEEIIEQALLATVPSVIVDPAALKVLLPTPLYGAMTSNLLAENVVPGGYHKRKSEEYDMAHCLIPQDVLDFIYVTQPKEWEQFRKQHEADAKMRFFQRLSSELRSRGTLDVLRKGIKANGCKFQLAYFPPSSGLNYALLKLYAGNILSEIRQLHYSEKNNNSLDLVLFLNGLPIFTAELKNPFMGQNVQHAVQQYRFDRDSHEPLFAFGRCLAHFAVDPDLVYMTSHLEGPKTRFLPFNKGKNGGAGNPPSWKGFATAYLWEYIWARDSILDLVQHFIQFFHLLDEMLHQVDALPGKRFAVIIDEAHSSQSGENSSSLKLVLTVGSLDDVDMEERDEGDDAEDRIVEAMKKREQPKNVSFFAFTATPKPKTLELFGTKRSDGKFEAFSLYSMRQAIEEHFILDVLENYTTYKTYWSLLKKIKTDPHYDRTKATLLLKSFVEHHEQTISRKVAIIVEHFIGQVVHRIDGRARAMIVTRSRLQAIRYKQAVDRYLKEYGYPYKSLLAFSGTVKVKELVYTEANMNGFPDSQTVETFKQEPYRILIVANKFQTGFDQPLLHTMYVDKKLGGVNAVQTLSRLNRIYPGKNESMVLDFANEAEEIQKGFAPYYEKTLLSEGTDPNLLYDLQTRLANFHFYTEVEINNFARLYFDPKGTQDKLYTALTPIVDRYRQVADEDRSDFRGHLTDYVRLYAFLAQILTFVDTDLEKLYVFGRLLLRRLPNTYERLPVEIQQNIDIESYRIKQTSKGSILLPRGTTEIAPIGPKEIYSLGQDEMEPLSQIIKELNEHFGTDFSEDDKVCIRELEQRLAINEALEASVRVNPPENARLTFDIVVNELLQDMIDGHFKFYKQVNDDPQFAKAFLDWLFDRYLSKSRVK
jgi:type I site-specific restriction-modification system R (restriction) subunit